MYMKRVFRKISIIVVALMTFTFVSCGGDDYPSEGYFKVGETTYITNEARLNDLGYDDESGLYQLRLTMDNTSHNDFHSINILFYSEVNNYLPSAVYSSYTYNGNYKNRFKRGAWTIGDNIENVFLKGNVKVTKNNDIYRINIDCEDIEGNKITGVYDGKIHVVN